MEKHIDITNLLDMDNYKKILILLETVQEPMFDMADTTVKTYLLKNAVKDLDKRFKDLAVKDSDMDTKVKSLIELIDEGLSKDITDEDTKKIEEILEKDTFKDEWGLYLKLSEFIESENVIVVDLLIALNFLLIEIVKMMDKAGDEIFEKDPKEVRIKDLIKVYRKKKFDDFSIYA